jgi:hypothetical protein
MKYNNNNDKVKGKGGSITCHEGTEEKGSKGTALLFL